MTYNPTFILGLPDNKMIMVGGYNQDGKLQYRWDGNSEFHNYLRIPAQNKNFIFIIWYAEPTRNIKKPDIVLNCITDPDSTGRSLKRAVEITNSIKKKYPDVPVFNDPSKISATSREKIYQLYNSLPGLYIPKVARIKPESTQDVLHLAKENDIKFPFLIRMCGAHESQSLSLIKNKSSSKLLEKYAYNGSEYYITEFADYQGENGLYEKARLVIIGGQIYPRHYITGEDWMVHGDLHETYMKHNISAKQTEENFINNFHKMINSETLKSFQKIYSESGLDYLGFDFAIRPDGSALIFEINPAQNTFLDIDEINFPYLKSVRDNIIDGFNSYVGSLVIKDSKIYAQKS